MIYYDTIKSISFVVINQNNKKTINACIAAIRRLKYKNKQIILVDDSSVDRSLEFLKNKPDKLFTNRGAMGVAFSRCVGINKAGGDFVFIIDSDIELLKIDIKKIISYFKERPNLVAASGNYYSRGKDNWNRVLDLRRKHIYRKSDETYFYTLNENCTTFSGGFCVIAKSRIGKFEPNGVAGLAGEDLLFQLALLNKGYEFAYINDLVGLHHHDRGDKDIIRKAISENKGHIWLISSALSRDFRLPAIESIYTFPIFLTLGLITKSVPLILFEFSPYFVLLISHRKLGHLKLMLYEMLMSFLKLYHWGLFLLFSHNFNLITKIKFFFRVMLISFVAKPKILYQLLSTNVK